MDYSIIKQREVFRSKSGRNAIYEAACDGEPCYCLEHVPSGRIALFDRDRRICNLLRHDIEKRGTIIAVLNGRRCYFSIKIKGRYVPLTKYMTCRYNKQSVHKICNFKAIIDSINTSPTVDDLRSKNIYDTSKPIESTPIRRVWSDGSKIYIQLKKTDKPFVTDYDPVLLDILQTPSLCTFFLKKDKLKKVKYLSIQSNKVFSCIDLHVFVYLYFTRFKDYGQIKSFLEHLDDERAAISNDDYTIDHYLGDVHNNCKWNLSRIKRGENAAKLDLTSRFYPPYEFYGAVDDKTGEYLVEVTDGIPHPYKCKSITELNDLLSVTLGKSKLTKHTKIYSGGRQMGTPSDLISANGSKPIERDFQTDNCHAEILLRMNRERPGLFTPWNVIGNGIPVKALMNNGIQVDVEPVTMGK